MNRTVVGILCGLGAASIWGGMYVVSKVVLEIIPPFSLVTLRLLLGAITLVIVLFIRGFPNISRRQIWQVLGVGFVGYGISLSLQFLGTKLSTAANGSLVTSATPAFVLLFAWIFLGEKITARRLLALFLATMGVIAVIDPRSAQLNPELFLGNLLLIGAAVTWATYSVLVRKVTQNIDVLLFRGRLGVVYFRGWRDQPRGCWRCPFPWRDLYCIGDGPLEYCVCLCGCKSGLSHVLCTTPGWYVSWMALSQRKDHTSLSAWWSFDRHRSGDFQS